MQNAFMNHMTQAERKLIFELEASSRRGILLIFAIMKSMFRV